MPGSVATHAAAMEGNPVSTGFQHDKVVAVRCWQEVLQLARAAGVDDEMLAAEAGMSAGYFSKVSSGQQGDLLGLSYRLRVKRPELHRAFISRLAAHEAVANPLIVAVDEMMSAAQRVLVLAASGGHAHVAR